MEKQRVESLIRESVFRQRNVSNFVSRPDVINFEVE
jgi:hypothetical protein